MKKYILSIILILPFCLISQNIEANKQELCEVLTEMKRSDQYHRKREILENWKTKPHSKKVMDSIWKLQITIDNANTEKLISLTKKYGWLSDERLNCDTDQNIFLIFRHSQEKYFEEISEIIITELDTGNLSAWQYQIIENHLNGRPHH